MTKEKITRHCLTHDEINFNALFKEQSNRECFLDCIKKYKYNIKNYNAKGKVKKLSLSYKEVDSTRYKK